MLFTQWCDKTFVFRAKKGSLQIMFHEFFILFVLNVSPALWVQLSWEVKVSVSSGVFYRNGKVTVYTVQMCVCRVSWWHQ